MKLYGRIIKSWVFNKTLFFLITTKKNDVPIIINSRDMYNYKISKNGYLTGNIAYNKFKNSIGSSKQYFGNKASMDERDEEVPIREKMYNDVNQGNPENNELFNEYDPFNEESYYECPDEQIELLGYETTINSPDIPSEVMNDPSDSVEYPYDGTNPVPNPSPPVLDILDPNPQPITSVQDRPITKILEFEP